MKIDLTEIYAGLQEWTDERKINVKNKKENYLMFTMAKFGELSEHLYDLNSENDGTRKEAELGIARVLCDIAVYTIISGGDIPDSNNKITLINPSTYGIQTVNDLFVLVKACAEFACYPNGCNVFNDIMEFCADICLYYGFNFEIAMSEALEEANSRSGYYDENTKQWILDESEQAKKKWHTANYEKARVKND